MHQRPWDVEEYEAMLHRYVEVPLPRWWRVLAVTLRRSRLRALWRRFRRYFTGPA